jgi:predicted DNA-binding transcriptional regulator YafY
MGKTSASIKLIQILTAKKDFISTDELAEMLETNKRNIREYVQEIEEAGYFVESKRGLTGGYRILNRSTLPATSLTDEEINALKDSADFLKDNNFESINEYNNAVSKFLSSVNYKDDLSPEVIYDKFPLSIPKKELMDRYQTVADAIEDQYKCDMHYKNSKNIVKRHTIHPYKLFNYNSGWFVLAYDEDVNDFSYFKLNRMESIYKKKSHFTKMEFDENEYLDEFGMKKNGEYYHVELEFSNLNVYIEERVYGKNQELEIIDDNHIKLSCDMQNKDMIVSFVLSFKSNCKVLAPDWLKEEVSNELLKMIELYD